MVLRYALAFILTIVLLVIARQTSTRHPHEIKTTASNVTLAHKTVTESYDGYPVLELKSSVTATVRAVVYFAQTPGGPYRTMEMVLRDSIYITDLPRLEKGQRWYYNIQAYQDNLKLAKLPLENDQFIKFKGHVAPVTLVTHIICMFATIFFGLLTVFTAFDYSRGRGDLKQSVRFLLFTVAFAFVGGFPLGYAVALQAFGQGWSGIPFGWDITDNKTVILFAFWLITLFLSWPALRGKSPKISAAVYATLVTVSFFVTFLMFLIPHSI